MPHDVVQVARVRPVRADLRLAVAAVGGGGGGAGAGGAGGTGYEFLGAEEEMEVCAATNYRARAPAQQAAAANNGGGGYGITAHDGTTQPTGGGSSLVGRVLRLGSAAGIDVVRADDPDRHWLDHYEHPVPGIATDLIVAHLHHHFVNGTLLRCYSFLSYIYFCMCPTRWNRESIAAYPRVS